MLPIRQEDLKRGPEKKLTSDLGPNSTIIRYQNRHLLRQPRESNFASFFWALWLLLAPFGSIWPVDRSNFTQVPAGTRSSRDVTWKK